MNTGTPALWITAVGLGAFHGVNPAMGWLFALALGLYAHSKRVVLLSLVPIALGHALSVALVLAGVLTLGSFVSHETLARGSGVLLIGWGAWRAWRGHRGRPAVGMRTGLAGLALWSFVMSSAHGAGFMLVPALLPFCGSATNRSSAGAFEAGAVALSVHTVAMLAVIAGISLFAMSVHERTGLAFLRSGWINVDWLWSVALIACGVWILL
ncbi:hypothetical protein [Caballeronia grimmiae]|uniref:hypothetical protein n=1 Tax=Caballeronia grimmiae TaxID=1071679 RepID=UPI0038B74B7C